MPREQGILISTDALGKETVQPTYQCCHCGGHWIEVKGSGRIRGFCQNCGGRHCGGPNCWSCVPMEKQLEIMEGKRQRLLVGNPRPLK